MKQSQSKVQIAWGLALLLVGVAVISQVPEKVPELAAALGINAHSYLYICFYLIGAVLAISGAGKIFYGFRSSADNESDSET